jgi:glycosyltransferase involved in cell wall biosynthesis
LRLLKDKQLREQMGARGKTRAKEYEWSTIAARMLDFYQETLKKIKKD